jgi:hypothetical protein
MGRRHCGGVCGSWRHGQHRLPIRPDLDRTTRPLRRQRRVIGLAKSLACEVSARDVRVNAVAPGPVNTRWSSTTFPRSGATIRPPSCPWNGLGSPTRWPRPALSWPRTPPSTSARRSALTRATSRCEGISEANFPAGRIRRRKDARTLWRSLLSTLPTAATTRGRGAPSGRRAYPR